MVEVISYPKISALSYIEKFLHPTTTVVVQEKLDGSNVGIRRVDGQLVLQSRTTIINPAAPGMFAPFVTWALANEQLSQLREGVVLYGEFVNNQGKIRYAEKQPFVLFDVFHLPAGQDIYGFYAAPNDLPRFAANFELALVPTIYSGSWGDLPTPLDALVANMTDKQEGVVVKAYHASRRWENPDTGASGVNYLPILAGKVVRDAFKETSTPRTALRGQADTALDSIAEALVTPARVRKAVLRVVENGGDAERAHTAIPFVSKDAHDEDVDLIKEMLFKAYWKPIGNRIARRTVDLHPAALQELAATAA